MDDLFKAMKAVGITTVIVDEEGFHMVASENTVEELYKLLWKYVPPDKFDGLMLELNDIAGNKSFRETVERLQNLHEWMKKHEEMVARNENL